MRRGCTRLVLRERNGLARRRHHDGGLVGMLGSVLRGVHAAKLFPIRRPESRAHGAARGAHQLVRVDGEDMARRPRGRPHDVVSQEVAVDERAQRSRVAERRDTADGEPGRGPYGVWLRAVGPCPRRLRRTRASSDSSNRFEPDTSASTISPSTSKASDFTICPTSTPTAAAASSAVRVPSGNSRTSTSSPRRSPASTTRCAAACIGRSSYDRPRAAG